MSKKESYVPPPDPDFERLAVEGFRRFTDQGPKVVAFDTETEGFAFDDPAFCVSAAWEGPDGIESHYFELERFDSSKYVQAILAAPRVLIGHNLKFDLQKAIYHSLIDRVSLHHCRLHDTEALAHLDNEHRVKGLKALAVEVLGYNDIIEVEVSSGVNKGKIRSIPREKYELDRVRRALKLTVDDGYHLLPRAVLVPYALKDAAWTYGLYKILRPLVAAHSDLWGLYQQEMELSLVFLDMEAAGLGVSTSYVREKIVEYQKRIINHELKIEVIVGKPIGKKVKQGEFNPNSNPQIKEFFVAAGFDRDRYDDEVLQSISHPLATSLRELRADEKILGTYFRGLARGVRVDREGREIFHPSYRQHGTVTGRPSSGAAKGDSA